LTGQSFNQSVEWSIYRSSGPDDTPSETHSTNRSIDNNTSLIEPEFFFGTVGSNERLGTSVNQKNPIPVLQGNEIEWTGPIDQPIN